MSRPKIAIQVRCLCSFQRQVFTILIAELCETVSFSSFSFCLSKKKQKRPRKPMYSLVFGLRLDQFLYYCDKELQESHEHTM